MSQLKLGLLGTTRKENEHRLPVHPLHFDRIDPALRSSVFLQEGYGSHFDVSQEQLAASVAGVRSREELLAECDVVVLPKPLAADLLEMHEGRCCGGGRIAFRTRS